MSYREHYSTRETSQSQPVPGKVMVENDAGGYVFAIDDWSRLDRFLILASEGGTYYTGEQKLTVANAETVARCVETDGPRVVARIVEISTAGRAPKNDPALFVLAMCAGTGNLETRRAAFDALPQVARIGTHLFHFLEYVEGFRGWGRGLRRAVANWYNDMPVDKLAYQVVKYQQRDGWSHRDALRLAHPNPTNDKVRQRLYQWIAGKASKYKTDWPIGNINVHDGHGPGPGHLGIVWAFDDLANRDYPPVKKQVLYHIEKFGLTREMIPTQWLNEPDIWSALLQKMPLGATIRNLGKMTEMGTLKPMSADSTLVCAKLSDKAYIKKSRLHPLSILVAMQIYGQGHGMRGNLAWEPVREIIDALDEAFYLSFENVEATGKRTMLALDVSGSMSYGNIAGLPISPRVASAAMAMVTARTEKSWLAMGFSSKFIPLSISPRQRLDDIINTISGLPLSGTDCALPMTYALQHGLEIDTFVVYTDNETWAGQIHPVQALQAYRQKMNIPAKLVVVGMTATEFSIADPNDSGMLDVVGFDTATPQILADFVRE